MILLFPSGKPHRFKISGLDIFLAFGTLFFLGLLTHLFSSNGSTGSGALKVLFLPLALFFQLGAIAVLISKNYQQVTIKLLQRNVLLLISLFFIFTSVIWSIDKLETIRRSVALLGTTAFGVLLGITYSRLQLVCFFKNMFLFLVIISVFLAVVLPQYGTHEFGQFAGFWRGALSFKNQMGWAAAVFLVLWLSGFSIKKCISPTFIIGLFLGLLLLIQTRSSTGLIVLSVGGLILLTIYIIHKSDFFRPIIVLFFIILTVVAIGFYDVLFEMILNAVGKDASLTGRTSIWLALYASIENNLIIGVGYAAFWPNASAYFGGTWMAELNHAHNTYIELLVDLGIMGTILCLLFILVSGKKLYSDMMNKLPGANTVFTLFIMILVVGFSGKVIFVPNSGIWLLLVAFVVCSSQKNLTTNKGKN
jgi:O-antigen ligase